MLFRQNGRSLVVHTPAKLNLFLEILGKRPDGYHELETLMVTVGIYDTLTFTDGDFESSPSSTQTETSADSIGLRCFDAGRKLTAGDHSSGEFPVGRDNLVVRAAELLRQAAGVGGRVRINLYKRIPVAAGLAGGSSDAAATLVALNRFWNLKLAVEDLQGLAAQLGSDVGFFLTPGSAAICRGRGEQIEPVDLPLSLHFVIARPGSGLSTAVVYRHCRPAEQPRSATDLLRSLRAGRLQQAGRCLHNALQAPAEQLNTEVTQLRFLFSHQPVIGHLMSGSGTAYFGLCTHQRQAARVAARLRAARVGRVFVAQSRP